MIFVYFVPVRDEKAKLDWAFMGGQPANVGERLVSFYRGLLSQHGAL